MMIPKRMRHAEIETHTSNQRKPIINNHLRSITNLRCVILQESQ